MTATAATDQQLPWCESFETFWDHGTTRGLHHRCLRCGKVYRWDDRFDSLKVGPCVEPAEEDGERDDA